MSECRSIHNRETVYQTGPCLYYSFTINPTDKTVVLSKSQPLKVDAIYRSFGLSQKEKKSSKYNVFHFPLSLECAY